MATSSFSRDFTLDTKQAVQSFEKAFFNPSASKKINRSLVTPERERRGEVQLKRMLSR